MNGNGGVKKPKQHCSQTAWVSQHAGLNTQAQDTQAVCTVMEEENQRVVGKQYRCWYYWRCQASLAALLCDSGDCLLTLSCLATSTDHQWGQLAHSRIGQGSTEGYMILTGHVELYWSLTAAFAWILCFSQYQMQCISVCHHILLVLFLYGKSNTLSSWVAFSTQHSVNSGVIKRAFILRRFDCR